MVYLKRNCFLFLLIAKTFIVTSLIGNNAPNFDAEISPFAGQVNVFTGEYLEGSNDLSLNGPAPLTFRRVFTDPDKTGSFAWQFNHPGIIAPEEGMIAPESDLYKVHYEVDDNDLLSSIKITDREEACTFHTATISRTNEGLLIIKADDGREVKYRLSIHDPARNRENILIDEVIYPDQRSIKYKYRKHPLERKYLISKIETPSGGFIETEYYDNKYNNVGGELVVIQNPLTDFRIGRVKLQKAPTGPGGSSQIFQTFFYEKAKTIVKDPFGNKKIYNFLENGLIQSIEWWELSSLGEKCIKKINVLWQEEETKPFKIKSFSLEDGKKNILYYKTFLYDPSGNCIQESVYGNFSGLQQEPLLFKNGVKEVVSTEKSVNTYRYTVPCDGKQRKIAEKIDDKGLITRYFYDARGGCLSSLILCNKEQNFIRQFFSYDETFCLINVITDDGQGNERNDLTGVTERRTTRFKRFKKIPHMGLIAEELETALDFTTGEEVFVKRTKSEYDAYGNRTKQIELNALDQEIHEKTWEYDINSRLLKSSDTLDGQQIFEYSLDGKIQEEFFYKEGESPLKKRYFYDKANRLILIESECGSELKKESFIYNTMGQKTASIDEYGNETFYEYNGLGKLKVISYPIIATTEGYLMRPREEFTTDLFGNKVCIKDPNGYVTKKEYNIRHKPTKIHHADGSSETFIYSQDGSLTCKIDQKNIKTEYFYDPLGRIIKNKISSECGNILNESSYSYSSFRLKEGEDKAKISKYTYDAAGFLQSVSTAKQKGILKTDYTYDDKGLLAKKDEWEGNCLFTTTITERDTIGRIIQERIEDETGSVIRCKTSQVPSPQVESIACETRVNLQGMRETVKRVVDKNGVISESFLDALQRLVRFTRKNCFGEILEDIIFTYDLCGNKTSETHGIFTNGTFEGNFKIAWRYGPGNRIDEIKEISSDNFIRKTEYLYNNNGLLKAIVKPNGETLNTLYNEFGKIKRVSSSDNTVDYTLEYDANGNITQAIDQILGTKTLREYDEEGFLIREVLGNELSLSSSYDAKGRRKKLTLPDMSEISYVYDSINLNAISRINPFGDILYSHRYSTYDLKGNILSELLPNDLGIKTSSYKENGMLYSIKTPWFQDEYLEFDETTGFPINRCTSDAFSKSQIDYTYDYKGQLEAESDTQYSYDTMGNRISSLKCIYDINGNLVKKLEPCGNILQFSYDALDRLIKVIKNDELIAEYVYDPFHRRIEKKTYDGSLCIKTNKFIWDGPLEIGMTDESKNIEELRVLGTSRFAEIGASVSIEIQGEAYLPIQDLTGSIRGLVSFKTSEVVERYNYSSFGEEEYFLEVPLTPWRFSGKRVDEETGFVLFGRRYLDPELGRWISLDPFGYKDGPNRYIFALNNPLINKDPQGLFIMGFFSFLWDSATKVYSFKEEVAEHLQTIIGYDNYLGADVTTFLEATLGKELLGLSGHYNERAEEGIYGQGEPDQNVRITLINGISNLRVHFSESMEHILRTHGGNNIHYIFRPTRGLCWDMINGLKIKLGFISPYAEKLSSTWKKLIHEMGGVQNGGLIIHYCHSLGGSDTAAAVQLLTEDERKMIRVFSFGSATMIPSNLGFESVTNFISMRDGVTLFDPIGVLKSAFNEESNVVFVGTIFGVPLIDHVFASDTYVEIIRMLGLMYMKTAN